jgi:uncharacterized repeat protein (TIGR01451 family)
LSFTTWCFRNLIGTAVPAGDYVTYRVKIANPGNVAIRDVQYTSNAQPALSGNTSAIADSLSLGEEVVLESNITYNNTMIRAPNVVLWFNVTANSSAGPITKSVHVTVAPTRCTVNTTGALAGHCPFPVALEPCVYQSISSLLSVVQRSWQGQHIGELPMAAAEAEQQQLLTYLHGWGKPSAHCRSQSAYGAIACDEQCSPCTTAMVLHTTFLSLLCSCLGTKQSPRVPQHHTLRRPQPVLRPDCGN